MRRVVLALVAIAAALFGTAVSAEAAININVNIATQRMTVTENGVHVATWAVSTARRGARTPPGTFRPYLMRQRHFSSLYRGAPMPYSIFYSGNYAIHGTVMVRALGQPASAGCVRLHTDNARTLFGMVQRHGMRATRIVITNGSAEERAIAEAQRRQREARTGGGNERRVTTQQARRTAQRQRFAQVRQQRQQQQQPAIEMIRLRGTIDER